MGRRVALDDLGFVWSPREFVFNNQILPALNVPYAFRLPSSEDVLLNGFKLGKVVSSIRSNHSFVKNNSGRRAALDDIGFVWDSADFIFSNQILQGLKWYSRKSWKIQC